MGDEGSVPNLEPAEEERAAGGAWGGAALLF